MASLFKIAQHRKNNNKSEFSRGFRRGSGGGKRVHPSEKDYSVEAVTFEVREAIGPGISEELEPEIHTIHEARQIRDAYLAEGKRAYILKKTKLGMERVE